MYSSSKSTTKSDSTNTSDGLYHMLLLATMELVEGWIVDALFGVTGGGVFGGKKGGRGKRRKVVLVML